MSGDQNNKKTGRRDEETTREEEVSAEIHETQHIKADGMEVRLPDEVDALVQASRDAALEGAQRTNMSLEPMGVVQASESDVTNEVEKGGPAFGSFVKAVGLAVAEAQSKLDETLVTTAKALSETQIEVIAIYEQQINDDGEMEKGNVITQKLPLINYLMPTAYQWTRVYLQADMEVAEFNAAYGFNIKASQSSFTAGAQASYGPLGFGAKGDVRYTNNTFQQQAEASTSLDSAAGKLHMEATLEPRADIELPKPFILQKGPRLRVTAGTREDILGAPPNGGGAAPVLGRQLTLNIELRDKSNNALSKRLQFKVSDPLINYTTDPADGTTNSDGKLTFILKREGVAFDRQKPPEPVVVNIWLGLVSEQIVINI